MLSMRRENSDSRPLLLVDDDTGLCNLMYEFLASHGFQLTAVHDGMTGFSKALTGSYDLILLDIMLPILDGLEVLRRLREKDKQTCVLILTAKDAPEDRVIHDGIAPLPEPPINLSVRGQ